MGAVIDIQTDSKLSYVLQLADNAMILGQRLSEWCGHGPVLEQDIAITNIALDLIGEARILYQYAAEIEGGGKTEDDYPYKRDIRQWKNLLLVEQPNGHWGHTIMRQFMFDCYHYYHLEAMKSSSDERLAQIAAKTIKEATYHLKYSSEWVIRLGDGTEESRHIAVDCSAIQEKAMAKFESVIEEATLQTPEVKVPQKGGKQGIHTEYMGYILAEMQFLQKSYPNSKW